MAYVLFEALRGFTWLYHFIMILFLATALPRILSHIFIIPYYTSR